MEMIVYFNLIILIVSDVLKTDLEEPSVRRTGHFDGIFQLPIVYKIIAKDSRPKIFNP